MAAYWAILRYKTGSADVTVYVEKLKDPARKRVSHVSVKLSSMDLPIRLTTHEARELRSTLNWCLEEAGVEE